MDKIRASKLAGKLNGKSVGGWKIIKFIDNGASAAVFKAEKDGIEVALKIIDPELEEKYGAENQEGRIELEKKLIGKKHPNLVRIYDGGRCAVTKYLYITMEFLPGKNLNDYVGKIPKDKIRSIIAQVAEAAKFLEDLELYHRDIKPANIHITDDFNKVVLMDLGILRHISGSGHGTGDQFIGSTKYSPPEFIYGEEEKNTEGWRAK